jgi:hypothetical protein
LLVSGCWFGIDKEPETSNKKLETSNQQPETMRPFAQLLPVSIRSLTGLGGGLLVALLLPGCAIVGNVPTITDDWYRVVGQTSRDTLNKALDPNHVYVQQRRDTLFFTPDAAPNSTTPPLSYACQLRPDRKLRLRRTQLDIDVFTLPFKVRPAREGVPVQLNTNFNAALYVGRRLDFYSLNTRHSTPFGLTPHVRATGFGYGAFVGAGSAFITADFIKGTPPQAEYEALVVHGGLAAIYDAQAFNVGIAVGTEQLLGPDSRNWIYDRQPWVGVLFGLDLN